MSLFGRIKNIIRSNINSKGSSYSFDDIDETYEKVFDDSYKNYQNREDGSKNAQKDEAMTLEQEYYANLELPYGAGFDEIKASYKKLLKKYHPDKFYGDEKKLAISQDVVKKLNKAYDYFCNKYN